MPPRNDLIAFVDLETTGSDARVDEIIEVGLAIYTWPAFTEDFAKSYVIHPGDEALQRLLSNEVVREMHKANGLIVDCLTPNAFENADRVDAAIAIDLLRYGSSNSNHIPLGGSGVSHFDRLFIRRDLPKFDRRLSYWAYDVGVLRRMFMLADVECTSADVKTHRALDDARYHAEEFKWYFDRIKERC